MRTRGLARTAMLLSAVLMLGGCAAPLVAGVTLGDLSMIGGAISTATTGKGLSDHALSYVTGKDCDLVEGILRKARKICEEKGSAETRKDFKGFFAHKAAPSPEPAQVAAASATAIALAPVKIPQVLPQPKPDDLAPAPQQMALYPPQ